MGNHYHTTSRARGNSSNSGSGVPVITSRDALERLCAFFASMNDPHLPITRAAADRLIALVIVNSPDAVLTAASLKCGSRPVLVLLGDDPAPHGEALGPDKWRCADMLRRWSRAAIIHGGAGHADHYRLAVEGTLIHRRLVLVETGSARAEAWATRLDCFNTLLMTPAIGVHPVAQPPGRPN